MTERAQNILNQMRKRNRERRILTRLKDPSTMDSINRMDQDETSRVGSGDQEMKVLREMNELQQFENENCSKGSV